MSSEKELRLAAEAVKMKAVEDRLQAELAMRSERQRRLELAEEAAASKAGAEALRKQVSNLKQQKLDFLVAGGTGSIPWRDDGGC